MWFAWSSVAVAQVMPGDFGRPPNLLPRPAPVEVQGTFDGALEALAPRSETLRFADGSVVDVVDRRQDDDVLTFDLVRPRGPLKRTLRLATAHLRVDASTFEVRLRPRSRCRADDLDDWVTTTLEPWLVAQGASVVE